MSELSYSEIEAVLVAVKANISKWAVDLNGDLSERGEAQLGAVQYFADRLLVAAVAKDIPPPPPPIPSQTDPLGEK